MGKELYSPRIRYDLHYKNAPKDVVDEIFCHCHCNCLGKMQPLFLQHIVFCKLYISINRSRTYRHN